jgi:hypothetical protein
MKIVGPDDIVSLFGESDLDEVFLTDGDLDKIEFMVRAGLLKLIYKNEETSGLLRMINECRRLNALRKKGIHFDAILK